MPSHVALQGSGGTAAAAPAPDGALVAGNNLSDLVSAGTARTNLGLAAVAASGSASNLSTGTLPIARIADGAVTLAKLANLTQGTIPGRAAAAGTGVPTALTGSDLSTILGTLATTKAYVDALMASGLLAANNLSDVSSAGTARTNLGLAAVAASGSASDLGTGTLPIARVADGTVTLAKQSNLAAATVIGRASGAGTGVPTALTGSDLSTILGTLATTKAYVDGLVQGLQWKASVRAATGASGFLSTAFAAGANVDNVTLATGDRLLIRSQSTPSENGIYTVNASGAPTRATDADTAAEILSAAVYVQEGDTYADHAFVCTTNAPIVLNTTGLTWVGFASALGALVATSNLSDLTDAANARSNLGLAAVAATGSADDITTGTLPLARVPVMVASGGSHAKGLAPDPGATAGTTKYLREDGTWVAPGGATTTVLSGTGTVAFTGLTGNACSGYRVHFFAQCSTSSGYMARLNTDSTSNYPNNLNGPSFASPSTWTTINTVTTGIPLNNGMSNAGFIGGVLTIHNSPSGKFRMFTMQSFSYDQGTGVTVALNGGGCWLDTTNQITEIDFVFSGTLSGFRAVLEVIP